MDRVRIGIIGCGRMARHHGRRFREEVPEAEIVGIADTHPDNLATFVSEVFGGDGDAPPAFSDHRTLLEEVEMDGVVLVTPHAHHFPQAMDAISAGCHVLVEKPMVINTRDALALMEHAALRRRTISVGFPGPFSVEFQYIRGLIERGELGDVYLVTGVCTQNWLARVRGSWRTKLELSGGGNMYDSGAHMFNGMLYLTGLAATEVFAFVERKGEEVDVVGAATIRFDNGALGTAAVSGDAPLMEQGLYIQGTRGAARCSIYGGSMEVWSGSKKVLYPAVPEVTSLQQNFVDCILGRATTPSPPLLGLRQARLMDAIYESARIGGKVEVVADGR
jgi:predicted dehydrogenase